MSVGANVWPGANLVVQDTGAKFVLKYQDRTRWVEKLKVCCRALSCWCFMASTGYRPHTIC